MNKSDSIKEIATALSKAQGELKNAKPDKVNPFFKSKYADLAALWNVSRSVLAKHGLSISQGAPSDENGVTVETLLMHSSGEWIESKLLLHAEKQTPQGMGSAITYGRRYSFAAMLGLVADEDDDGNESSKSKKVEQKVKAEPIDNVRKRIVSDIVSILTDKVFTDEDRAKAKETIKNTVNNKSLAALRSTYQSEQNKRIEGFKDDIPEEPVKKEAESEIDKSADEGWFEEETKEAEKKAEAKQMVEDIY